MALYKAPLADIDFLLNEFLDKNLISEIESHKDFDQDFIKSILEEGAKICEEKIHPLNKMGDREGCLFQNGTVSTPKGFKDLYDFYIKGGWTGLACDPEYGGQGLPKTVSFMFDEMLSSSNLSFKLCSELTYGAYSAISEHGTEETKKKFLPNMVSGKWSGTMCLTEAHCGTDLGMLKTKAVPTEEGFYKISGQKIFITYGDHDLTENIIHLVLARIVNAPQGTKGISMFIVPKYIVKSDGSLGDRNNISTISIEKKMGIKGSPTCTLSLEESQGYLLGQPNKGLSAMFTMMNLERLVVGIQGLGLGEIAYQNALSYSKERLQGRSPSGIKFPDKSADPLICHPDISKSLLTIKVFNEGCRALVLLVAQQVDIMLSHPNNQNRNDARELVALMTPIIKAFLSDLGFEATNSALHIWGGHGYIQDNELEQFTRDAKITQIYEGTNGIQALDLVTRKISSNNGRNVEKVFDLIGSFIKQNQSNKAGAEYIKRLQLIFGDLKDITKYINDRQIQDKDFVAGSASDYLKLFGLVLLAYVWARMAIVSNTKSKKEDFYRSKIVSANFYYDKILPQSVALVASIKAGCVSMVDFSKQSF